MKQIIDPKNKHAEAEGLVLTEKMERFIQEYFVDYNASAAAVRAGYSDETPTIAAVIGHKLMRHPLISIKMDEIRETIMLQLGVQQEYVINNLLNIINNNKGKNDTNVLKALDMLAKIGGMYTQTITNINVEVPLFNDFE